MAEAKGLRKLLQDVASAVGSGANAAGSVIKQGVNKLAATPINEIMTPGVGSAVNKILPKAIVNRVPTVGQAGNFAADITYRPVARVGFEGAQTFNNDNKTYTPSTPAQKFILGDRPLRNWKDEERDGRRFARWAGVPQAGNALVAAGVGLDLLALPGTGQLIAGGTRKVLPKVGLRALNNVDDVTRVVDKSDELLDSIKVYQAMADKGDEAAKATVAQLKSIYGAGGGAVPNADDFLRSIGEYSKMADDGDEAARMTVENLKDIVGKTKSGLRTAADSRPAHQIAIEDALNANKLDEAKKLIESLSDADTYKSSMKSLYETIAGATDWAVTPGTKELLPNLDEMMEATKPLGKVARDLAPKVKEQLALLPNLKYTTEDIPGIKTLMDGGGNVMSNVVEPLSVRLRQVGNISKKKYNELGELAKNIPSDTRKLVDTITDSIADNTVSPLVSKVNELSDISSISAGQNTLYRNFKTVFGKNFNEAKQILLDPFDAAKGQWIENQKEWLNALNTNVVQNLGIKKGSKLSELTQLFGEKKIDLDQLKTMTNDWQKVVDADNFFRSAYNQLLDEVNAVRANIYPNNPEKIIPKREDYYRHFQEMAEGFQGFKNIFDNPANIPSTLSGISEFVKPKSKFLSFAQRREGDKTTLDAVGGFLDYIKSATYAKYIDPQIGRFRTLANELAVATEGGANKNGLNNFIEYLQDFSNDLSGKTNALDRGLQKWVGGRKVFQALDWANSRYKANAVLGNLSSSLNQLLNIPAGIADSGIKNYVMGSVDEVANIFRNGEAPIDASTFIKERYFDSAYDKFNSGMLSKTKDMAKWLLTVGDELGTKTTWYAQYRKALGEGLTGSNAVKYADDATRNLVGGRGVGEVPLFQKSKLTQVFAPFQLEIANQWYVMKDWVDEKQFGKFITFFMANQLLNDGLQQLTGNRPGFDPIEALMDGIKAYDEEDNKGKGVIKLGGRLTGEVLSNMPYVQSFVAQFDELPLVDTGLTKKEVFGQQDPTRYGAGVPFAKILTEPQYFLAPPFGGGQIKKTIGGAGAVVAGGVYDANGNLSFPVGSDLGDKLRTIFFGKYASPEATLYFAENLRPLSEKETYNWKRAVKVGNDPVEVWARLYQTKARSTLADKIKKINRDSSLSREERMSQVATLENEFTSLSAKLDEMAGDYKLPKPIELAENPNDPNYTGIGAGGSGTKRKAKAGSIRTPKLRVKSTNSSNSRPVTPQPLRFEAPNIEALLAQADKELKLN